MQTLGIRDIIGPVMIGPSSSHTAGALRIALMCRHLLAHEPARVTFTLYGSFAHTYHGHGTDRALVAGMLGLSADDERIRDSFELACAAGLICEFVPDETTICGHPNTVDIEVIDAEGVTTCVRGESIGGGAAHITRLNGIDVELTGEYHSLVVKHYDRKGVLAFIATTLASFDVNIATTRLFREQRGDIAYTVMETDDELPATLTAEIATHSDVIAVRALESDRSREKFAPLTPEQEAAAGIMPSGFGIDMDAEEATALFAQLDFASGEALLAYCEEAGLAISDAICRRERCLLVLQGIAVDDTHRYVDDVISVMRASVKSAVDDPQTSMGGLIGGEARRLVALDSTGTICDSLTLRAITYAMAVLETNASMGRIVAAPTAGSAGVLPGVLLALADERGFTNAQLNRAVANAAAIGMLVARASTVSGAEGGCQAEVGTASAMAASAAVELAGGSPAQCLDAAAIALSGLMGLVCDPIGGLVEAPCQKRNATGAANALVAAQLALAGIKSTVNFDETVWAMDAVGRSLPFELRESALGGLAATPTARVLCSQCPGCEG